MQLKISANIYKDSLIYTVSEFINKAIPFIFIPILTRFFNPSDYGILAIFTILLSITMPFIGLNSHAAILKKYFDSEQKIDLPLLLFNSFALSVITAFVLYFGLLLFAYYYHGDLIISSKWISIIILISFLEFLVLLFLTVLQANRNAIQFGLLQISRTLFLFLGTIFFVVLLKYNWEGRVFGQLISSGFFFVLTMIYFIRKKLLFLKLNLKVLLFFFAFGLPLIPHELSKFVTIFADRYFTAKILSVDETGIYTLAFQIGSLVGFISDGINKAWLPWFYKSIKKPSQVDLIVKRIYLNFVFIILAMLILNFFVYLFFDLFVGDGFHGAKKYIPIISLSFTIKGFTLFFSNFLFQQERTKVFTWLGPAYAVFYICLNYLLLVKFQLWGLVYGSLLTNFLYLIFTWVISQKGLHLPWFSLSVFRIK